MSKKYEISQPILIVDDEEDLRDLLGDISSSLGLNCVFAANGKEGLDQFKKHHPFLVLTDLKMPEMTGDELIVKIREVDKVVPVILLTGFADKENTIVATNVGVSKILEKPFDAKVIGEEIEYYASRKAGEAEAEDEEQEEIRNLFVEESRELLGGSDELILRLEEEPIDSAVIDSLFRSIHSIKGGAGAIPGAELLGKLAHQFESSLSLIRDGKLNPDSDLVNVYLEAADFCSGLIDTLEKNEQPDQETTESVKACIESLKNEKSGKSENKKTVKKKAQTAAPVEREDEGVMVTNEKLDSFVRLSGELIVLKNYFQLLANEAVSLNVHENHKKKISDFSHTINKITDQLQEQIMSIRRVRLDRTFSKLPRIVRQASQEAKKQIDFKTIGLELGVDKSIGKALNHSLVHMVRNSIDHGIEPPEERIAKKKAAEGKVQLECKEVDGKVRIVLEDDGRGIAKEKILNKAIENRVISEGEAPGLSEEEIFDLIFLPGFSTAEKVTSLSGRGVGMDAVRSAVIGLNGSVKMSSTPDVGTVFTIDIPIPKTVMVEETVVVRTKGVLFAIPLVGIGQIVSGEKISVNEIDHRWTCQIDSKTVPLVHYENIVRPSFLPERIDVSAGSVVFLNYKNHMVGLAVDDILDQLEAVIRPFDAVIRKMPGLKGTTVLGDDSIAYVVDHEKLVLAACKSGESLPAA